MKRFNQSWSICIHCSFHHQLKVLVNSNRFDQALASSSGEGHDGGVGDVAGDVVEQGRQAPLEEVVQLLAVGRFQVVVELYPCIWERYTGATAQPARSAIHSFTELLQSFIQQLELQ